MSVLQVSAVPAWNQGEEFAHSQQVRSELELLRDDVTTAAATGRVTSESVTLGSGTRDAPSCSTPPIRRVGSTRRPREPSNWRTSRPAARRATTGPVGHSGSRRATSSTGRSTTSTTTRRRRCWRTVSSTTATGSGLVR
ncbi:hypothetical protein [Haloarcula pelagica]